MAYLDPTEAFSHLKERVMSGLAGHFPMQGKVQSLHLDKLEVKDELHPDDIRGQHKAKVEGGTWSVPVYAHLSLKDNETGKLIDQKKIRIAEIPKTTRRYSYVVDGQEYQLDNQWQLKPGVYARRRDNGELEARFNVAGRRSFDVLFDPAKKEFHMEYGKAHLPIYPVMKTMGVSDDALEKAWGKEILEANQKARLTNTTLERFYKTDKRVTAPSREAAAEHVYQTLTASKLRPDASEATLGKAFDHVSGEALQRATEKMLKVHAGHPEDDRDSLVFKDLRTVGDFAHDKLSHNEYKRQVQFKIARKINTAKDVRDIVKFDWFQKPILDTFHKNAAARAASQINPVEMVSSSQQTTLMGPGGIQSERSVTDEAKFVNPSHMGFLDPINTPEGCFDEETEVYTFAGWKGWPDVTAEDLFACRVDDHLEFHKALELQAYHYQGIMHGVRKPWLEYLVTPSHRVLCRPYANRGESTYRVERADEMHGHPRLFPIAHKAYLGQAVDFFELPYVAGNNSSKNVDKVLMKDWAEFMGWYLAEGGFTYNEERSQYHVMLHQSCLVNAENCRRIEALIERLPFRWSSKERDHGRNKYTCGVKQLAHYVSQFGAQQERYIPEYFFSCSAGAREVLLDALLRGDGRLTADHKNSRQDSAIYTTTSPRLAIDVERLAISLGYATSTHVYKDRRAERYLPVHEVVLLRDTERSALPRKGHYYTAEYDGMVYCATVPGSFLYVRRNGKHPLWSGNSKTGVTLRLPIGIRKVGDEAKIPLYNLATKKTELVRAVDFVRSNVVLPDQVKWEGGHPIPLTPSVKMAATDNVIRDGKFADAHYVMKHSSQLFNLTSNLIPFLGNTSGVRAGMASRQIEQAISLVHREIPLVQVSTGSDKHGIHSFEVLLGKQASHSTPVAGTVHDIKNDAIIVADAHGKKHEVQIYRNFPLNDAKGVMDSTPIVKVGDKVSEGQVIADTNFSKRGVLALGTNLRVAYLPFKGYNFEDGIVISETAAKKLTSEHLHKPVLTINDATKLSTKTFALQHPEAFSKEQLAHLGDDGVVKVGHRVAPGDPLIAATQPFELKDRTGLSAIRRSMTGTHTDKSLRWDSETPGEVVAVHRKKGEITVHVRTFEPMQVGDKLAGRYGNKGIVTMLLPDHEMPHTKDGKPIEVALNPSGIPGRINIGQVLETAAAKIAEKTGKPYLVKNFEPGVDFVERMKHELKEHGLEDQEELFDPKTKQSLGKAMLGPQHMLKLVHQVDKKLSVRSGMSLPGSPSQEHYNLNLQPSSGGGTGGQSIGALGMYALLAHGATANIREMQTYKSEGSDPQTDFKKKWPSQHNEVWAAIQTGAPLPPPKPTFAFQKFTEYLRAAGINMEKKGHQLVLTPYTDKQIKELAPRALPKAGELLFAKLNKNGDPMPKPGGLFDEEITGGHGGRKWSRIDLAEPVPNPVFESAIRRLTGLKQTDFDAVVHGHKSVSPAGQLTELSNGVTGGHGIKLLLDKIDVKKELSATKKALTSAKGPLVDNILKKVKYLRALDETGMKPSEAYILHHLPVLPPSMRPVTVMQDGNLKYSDINGLYSEFAQVNDKLGDPVLVKHLSDAARQDLRADHYDGVKALMGVGIPYADAKQKGLLHYIAGSSPKHGFFQDALVQRKQDLTMRSTIVPEPALGLDEVGIPKDAALDLFRPFVVQKLVHMGAAKTALDAPAVLVKKGPEVWKALDQVMEERPVLLKRDPALHKYSVQAFKARPVVGNAIQIHPLVTGGFNADFDGDTMSVYVPIHHDAVAEAHKMFPSHNLFSEATGKVMYQPTLESALGLYKLSMTGKNTGKKFTSSGEAVEAVRSGKHHMNDIVHVGSNKTTAGRILLAAAVPEAMQHKMLTDIDTPIDKKHLDVILTEVAKQHGPDYGEVVNHLKDLGNGASSGLVVIPKPLSAGHGFTFTKGKGASGAALDPSKTISVPIANHSLGLDDFSVDKESRDKALSKAEREVKVIYASAHVPEADKDRRAVAIWERAGQEMRVDHEAKLSKDPNNLFLMYKAGVKPGWDQYRQMALAPMLLRDSANRIIPTPVTKSYSEGLDVGGYWTGMHGARRGVVMKVQEVREPGYLSKLLMNNMMHMTVNSTDCGTDKGIALPVSEKDVHDRHLAQDFVHGQLHVPAGTLLTPDIVGKIRAAKKDAQVVVRSPLKCEEEKGICQKCMGLSATGHHHDLGTNIGVQAAHALGERAIQLTLRVFHTGGVQEQSGGGLVNSFTRFQQLMHLDQKIPNAAGLAMKSGKIDKIDATPTGVDITIAGEKHFVGKDASGMPLHQLLPGATHALWAPPKVGQHIEAGQHLTDPTRTFVNPHDLYKATGSIEKVQHHMTNEIYDLYKSEGIHRRSIETVVRAVSNLTKVDDPGDHPELLRGEFRSLSSVKRMNAELAQEKKRLIEHTPVLKGVEMLPLSLQEDWMAKLMHQRLRDTLTEAASTHGVSNLHGSHPIPGIAYGAEFGLTKAVSKTPGHKHLADVPLHNY